MGDFDWDIADDRFHWSDELYRIHGLEPQSVTMTYEGVLAALHPDDRPKVKESHLHCLASGEPYFMTERIVRPDGDIRVVDTSALVTFDADGTPVRMRGVSVDVTGRSRIEVALRTAVAQTTAMAEGSALLELRLQDARLRRRQAVEINDNIIQGLTAAVIALEAGSESSTGLYLQRTLDAARRMMADLLAPLDGHDLDPSDLIRDDPPPGHLEEGALMPSTSSDGSGVGVLLVDDAEDLRFLFRYTLQRDGRFRVVGEASDGLEAIAKAEALQPQVILLDVAMPKLDGLGALPRIREAAPQAVIIVLSGFGGEKMADRALAAGAAAYIEKGAATPHIIEIIEDHLPTTAND